MHRFTLFFPQMDPGRAGIDKDSQKLPYPQNIRSHIDYNKGKGTYHRIALSLKPSATDVYELCATYENILMHEYHFDFLFGIKIMSLNTRV